MSLAATRILVMCAFAWLVACGSVAHNEASQTFAFRNTATNERYVYDLGALTWSDGHLVTRMRNCPSEYRCLRGGAIDFVLPETRDASTHWAFEGRSFDIAGNEQLTVAGRSIPVMIIRGSFSDSTMRYFFSEQHGLLGAEIVGPHGRFTLLSESDCGFGSSNCRRAQSR